MRLVYHYDEFIKDIMRTMLPRHKKSNGSEYPGSAQRHERSGNVPCFDRRPRTAVKDDLTKKKCLVLTDVLYRLSKMPDKDADVDANANALLTLGGYSDQPQPVFAVSSSNLIHTYSYLSLIISKGSNLCFFFILN